MKHRGVVTSVDDPKNLGRIEVSVLGFEEGKETTPWVWPCSPLAGDGYGFYCLPEVGDEVWVEQTAEGDWVYTGFFWSGRKPKPDDGTKKVRLFRTPSGHQIKLDEDGNIEVSHSEGHTIILKKGGDIDLVTDDGDVNVVGQKIYLNGETGSRVVTTKCLCAYTGTPHPQGSDTVFSEGP